MPSSKSLKVSNYKTHAKHHHSLHGTHKKRANQARKLRLADEEEEIIKMEEQKEFRKVLEDQVSRVNPEDLSPLPECRGLRIEDENPFAQLMMIMLQYQSFRSYPMYSEDDQVQEEQIKLQKASRFELMKQKRAIRREKRKVFKTLKRSISEVNPGDPSSSSTEPSNNNNNKRIKLSHQNIQQHQLQFIPNISSSNPLEHPTTVTARFDLMESNYMSEEEDDSNSSFHDDIYTLYNQTWDYQDSVNEFYQEEDSSTADSVDIDSLLVPSPVVFKPATSFTNCELIQALDQHQRQKQQQNQQHMVVSQVPVIHVSQPELRTQNHLIQQPWQSTAVQQSTTTTTTTATTTKTIPSYIPQQPPVIVKPVTVERTPVNILDQLHRSNNLVYAQQRQAQMGFVNI